MMLIDKDLKVERVKKDVFLYNFAVWSRYSPVNMFKNISSSSTTIFATSSLKRITITIHLKP